MTPDKSFECRLCPLDADGQSVIHVRAAKTTRRHRVVTNILRLGRLTDLWGTLSPDEKLAVVERHGGGQQWLVEWLQVDAAEQARLLQVWSDNPGSSEANAAIKALGRPTSLATS